MFTMCARGLTSVSERRKSIFHTVSSFFETTFRAGLTCTQGHHSHNVALVLNNMLLRTQLFSLFASVLQVQFIIMSIHRLAVILRESLFIKDSFLCFGSYCHQSRLSRGPRFGSHCTFCEVSVSFSMSLSEKQTNTHKL